MGFPDSASGKESASQCRIHRDKSSIPRSGRSGGRNGNALQYSCQENLMERGVWLATVHGVTKSRTQQSI